MLTGKKFQLINGYDSMKTLSRTASKVEVAKAVREWLELLAENSYDDAAAYLAKTDTPGLFESPDEDFGNPPVTWSSQKLEAVIGNFGVEGELTGFEGRVFSVASVDEPFREAFENALDVTFNYGPDDEFNDPEDAALDPSVGEVHVNLPLEHEGKPPFISDLTARLDLLKYEDDKIVIALRDIHVL